MDHSTMSRIVRQIAILCSTLALSLGLLILSLNLPRIATASGPEDGSGSENGAVIGLASNAATCLAVGNDHPAQAVDVVRLTWQGQVERARLVLSVAGAEAAHTIKVNGQPAALAPVQPGGQPCSAEEYFYLDVSPEVLVQGDNLIEITDEARPGDSWTAANVRLEVFGDVTVLPAGEPDGTGPIGPADIGAAAYTPIFTFTNPYDGSIQDAIAQIPDIPMTPAPLLIAIHGRSGTKESGLDWFAEAADRRGWLLASPELHGSWPIPDDCYDEPPGPDCQSEDERLLTEPGAYAYASLESQYDAIGTVNYMVQTFNVDLDQIYLAGYSMGGQTDVILAAKFPHLFAAVFDNKGPTDMAVWYGEQVAYYETPHQAQVRAMRKECYVVVGSTNTPAYPSSDTGTPANPFCYQRRSGIRFAGNYLHIPISMTHSESDLLVPIHHSQHLRDAINDHHPDRQASIYVDTSPPCGEPYHCYEPHPDAVLDFLEPFTLNNHPTHINITSDESKSYYWMNLAQTGGDHWSQVEVTYHPISSTVTATISDTHPLTVAFNLGSTPIGGIVPQPGMGLPATTYLVKTADNRYLHNYESGYLTTTLASTGQSDLTISAIEAQVSANPSIVSTAQIATSQITVEVRDRLNNPVPDGTTIILSTSAGTFPNLSQTYAAPASEGQLTTTLTLGPEDDRADIVASIENVTGSTSVDVIHPAITLLVTPSHTIIYSGENVTYTYQIANTGDATLTGVTLLDDNGTPGDGSDDVTVCTGVALAVGATQTCSRSTTLMQDTTNTATVTAHDPLGYTLADSDSATVAIASGRIYLPVIVRNGG